MSQMKTVPHVLAFFSVFLVAAADSFAQSTRATEGEWESEMTWSLRAVHSIMLRTGLVLCIDDGPLSEGDPSPVLLFDPATGIANDSVPQPEINLFCSGHAQLANGKILFASAGSSLPGFRHTRIYDPTNSTTPWSVGDQLPEDRWYSTCTTMALARFLSAVGARKSVIGRVRRSPQIFHCYLISHSRPASNSRRLALRR